MKPLASAAAGLETAEDIRVESRLWSIIKMGFLGSQKLPLGPVRYELSQWWKYFFRPIREQIFKQDFLFRISIFAGGEAAEVYWTSNGYHRGGYAYRLCRVPDGQYWKVTEECFQQGHLNFSGRKYIVFDVFPAFRWFFMA